MAVTLGHKRQFLLGFAGLVVGYVRNFIQYGEYAFSSLTELLGFWLVHYLALAFATLAAYGSVVHLQRFFLPKGSEEKITWENAMVYFSIMALVCAILIFLIAHFPVRTSDYAY